MQERLPGIDVWLNLDWDASKLRSALRLTVVRAGD